MIHYQKKRWISRGILWLYIAIIRITMNCVVREVMLSVVTKTARSANIVSWQYRPKIFFGYCHMNPHN